MTFCGSEDEKLDKILIEIGELMNVKRFVEDWC